MLDRKLRHTILNLNYIITAICFVFDMAFLLLYVLTDDLFYPLPVYICVRIIPPTAINVMSSFVAYKYNESDEVSSDAKNEACAATLCTIGGSMGIFHSFFSPLWLAPCIGMMFCGVFASKRLRLVLAAYSMFLMGAAAAFQCFERPGEISSNLQNLAVDIAISMIMYMISKVISGYIEDFGTEMKASALREQELETRMRYEPLTGIFFARPYFMEIATNILDKASPEHPVSLAMVDFDHFKEINDIFGHDNGDKVIKAFADLTVTMTGDDIIAGRYGGEEFVFMFDGGDIERHIEAMNYLRERFENVSYDFTDRHVTLSCGIVSCRGNRSYEDLFVLADKAVYRAKEEGRNKTIAIGAGEYEKCE